MPNMGFHFLNPSIGGEFDVTKPPILVYVKRGSDWQLGALEWVFTERPDEAAAQGRALRLVPGGLPLRGRVVRPRGRRGGRARRRHGTARRSRSGIPRLVTLHVWLWYPNPDGLYASTNPLVAPLTQRLGSTGLRRREGAGLLRPPAAVD